VYIPAFARTLVAAKVSVLPDKVISEVPVPPVTEMAKFIVQVVKELEVVELSV
jgi:hypothetical protein